MAASADLPEEEYDEGEDYDDFEVEDNAQICFTINRYPSCFQEW